jgi:hypothetical protein
MRSRGGFLNMEWYSVKGGEYPSQISYYQILNNGSTPQSYIL